MKKIFLSLLLFTGFITASAQTARLQVIHNAADPAANQVDVYLNGSLALDNFEFRNATPFIDVPANVLINIGIAPPNSVSADDTIKNFQVNFRPNKKYIAVANGVLDPSQFAVNPDNKSIGFTIFSKDDIREQGTSNQQVDFVTVHGATDAPTVDIWARKVSNSQNSYVTDASLEISEEEIEPEGSNFWGRRKIVNNITYSEIYGYRKLRPAQYIIEVTPGNNGNLVVASFNANLTGLGGGAAVVFASGFLDPSANQNGAAFGLFAALPNGTVVEFPAVLPTARLQVIHNAADPLANEVDVYVNGDLLLDNFAFRTATTFLTVPAGVTLNIGVAPSTSTSVNDTIKNIPVVLQNGKTYVAVANGVVGSGFSPNPDGRSIAFTLFAKDGIQESGMYGNKVDFVVLHGSTDAPAVDVIARNVGTLVDDAAYGDFTDYLRVPASSYLLDITPANDNNTIVATFEANLTGLGGGAAVVFASGFLDPSTNQNGAAFGLFAALPNGTVVEFPAILPTARLQVIHNAADPLANEVDVYVNGDLLLDNFAFRTATPFVTVPAGVTLNIGVAPSTSTSANDTIKNIPVVLENGKTYVAVANGVVGSGFSPNPDGRSIAFTLFAKDGIQESGMYGSKVDFVVLHGSTDAPAVDVIARNVGTLVDDAAYSDFTDYLRVPASSYLLDITPANDNNTIVATFEANLSGLGGGAAVVFASGFLDPSANQNGTAFGLFAALPNGTVVEFPAYTAPTTARLQIIHNAADPIANEVDIYVNGNLLLDNFGFRTATPYVDVPAGVLLNIGVAPGTSTSVSDTIKNFAVSFEGGKTYVAMANGVVNTNDFASNPNGRDIAFTLFAKADAREQANYNNKVDLFAVHGSTDAPAVNIRALFGLSLSNIAYGDISNYVSLPASRNWVIIYTTNPFQLVGVYNADLRTLGGSSAVVFASGFLNPSANQNGESFGVFVALANGAVVQLPKILGKEADDYMNKILGEYGEIVEVKEYNLDQNYPNPFNPSTRIAFSIPNNANVTLKVYDILGTEVAELISNEQKAAGRYEVNFDASRLASGTYIYKLQAGDFVQTRKMILLK